MAKIITDNPKGFKVIGVSAEETFTWGGIGVCDYCNTSVPALFYVPVLNCCYCQKCYDEWNERSIFFEDDRWYEDKMFDKYKAILGL